MKIQIQRDQAVWERETFEVEIPDNTPADELEEAIQEAVDKFESDDSNVHITVQDAVEGIDTQIKAFLPDGEEVNL